MTVDVQSVNEKSAVNPNTTFALNLRLPTEQGNSGCIFFRVPLADALERACTTVCDPTLHLVLLFRQLVENSISRCEI